MTASQAYATGKQTVGTIRDLMNAINDFRDRSISSLTEYTKRTLITSRVYIEDQLASEDITPKLLKMLNSIYSGFVFCAIGLSNLIVNGQTVRDMTAAVNTETFHSFLDDVLNKFGDLPIQASLEDNSDSDKKTPNASVSDKQLEAESQHLFTGRLLECQIPTGDPKQPTAKLYFYVQLLPSVIPQQVMSTFLEGNASPSTSLRWAMWKAGEISFWKDFIFEHDRVKKRRKALKLDKEGILREVEDHREQRFHNKIGSFIESFIGARRRHNDANTIVICTKKTVEEVCKNLSINMKNYGQRQSMMNGTMSVMICVYDPNYGTVELYMNGIEGRGEYSSKTIEAACKKKADPIDIKELLPLISAGSMPRF